MKTPLRPAALRVLCSAFALAFGIAQADVTIESSMAVEGVGAMAFANMSGPPRPSSGDSSRTNGAGNDAFTVPANYKRVELKTQ